MSSAVILPCRVYIMDDVARLTDGRALVSGRSPGRSNEIIAMSTPVSAATGRRSRGAQQLRLRGPCGSGASVSTLHLPSRWATDI